MATTDQWVLDNKRKIIKNYDEIMGQSLWDKMCRTAKTNVALQNALDHAVMIYKLSEEYNDGV